MVPALFICRPYSFRCDSWMFLWWMQPQSVEVSKLINSLLLISEFALSACITGDEINTFADGIIFCIKRRSSFIFSNISSGVKWRASLVPTWISIFFSLAAVQQRTSCSLWRHLERFALSSFFFSTFYIDINLINRNHPLSR